MKKILSLFAMFGFLLSITLAGPAFAGSANGNGATGIGQQENGTPPGRVDDGTTAKENAPGQQKKADDGEGEGEGEGEG